MKMKKIKLSLVVSVISIAIAFCTYAFSARRTNQINETPINKIGEKRTSISDKSNAKLKMEPSFSTVKKDELTPPRKKINDQNNVEVKTGENVDNTIRAFVQAFEQAIVRAIESYLIDALKCAIEATDVVEIQEAVDALIDCPGCLKELTTIVRDQSYDKRLRQYAAAALIKSGKAIPTVVGAIAETVRLEQNEFREGLLKALADLDSIEAAEVLVASLAGDEMLK